MTIEITSQQSVEMEILCSLSTRPASAKLLCEDFGLKLVKDLRSYVEKLTQYGIRIGYPKRNDDDDEKGGVYVWIEGHCWAETFRAAEEYWDRTHHE